VHFADEYDRLPVHAGMDAWATAPVYWRPHEAGTIIATLAARLAADAKAHEKEITVWSENYAALERRLAEVEAELDAAKEKNRWAYIEAAMDDRKTDAEAENAKLRAALEHEVKRSRRHLAASTLAALRDTKP
jgi:hypothetical protein